MRSRSDEKDVPAASDQAGQDARVSSADEESGRAPRDQEQAPQGPLAPGAHGDSEREGEVGGRRDERFRPWERLRRRSEFLEVQGRGRKVVTPRFVFLFLRQEGGRRRLGITVSRRVGVAVRRNRTKRLVREVFRRRKGELPSGDLVVIARRAAVEAGFWDLWEDFSRLIRKLRRGRGT